LKRADDMHEELMAVLLLHRKELATHEVLESCWVYNWILCLFENGLVEAGKLR